jgi:uncharacterized protein YbaR (Trm112 family)
MPRRSTVQMADLRKAYDAGENLMAFVRRVHGEEANDETAILCSYDLQAGTYVAALADPAVADRKRKIGAKLAGIFAELGADVVAEAGVGEATTLAEVIAASRAQTFLGFDISLSRLLHAQRHLASRDVKATLFTGALGAIPLPDDEIDLVYTFHSVEPNGGREREVLEELLRVTRHHLVLVEPSWELGSEATRANLEKYRYVKGLPATLEAMGCRVLRHERWALDANPANEAALTIVEKRPRPEGTSVPAPRLASPFSRTPLVALGGCLFSEEDGRAFPVLSGIPCLLEDNGVVATQLARFVR